MARSSSTRSPGAPTPPSPAATRQGSATGGRPSAATSRTSLASSAGLATARTTKRGASSVTSTASSVTSTPAASRQRASIVNRKTTSEGDEIAEHDDKSSTAKEEEEEEEEEAEEVDDRGAGTAPSPQKGSRSSTSMTRRAAPTAPTAPAAVAPSRAPVAVLRQSQISAETAREIEGLKTKLRVVEGKRAEDRAKLRHLEMLQAERDKFEGIIQKLQAKYQPQGVEIGDLRKTLKEKETRLEELERLQAENDSTLEMAALDRSMAEETADAFQHECGILRQRVEELQLEVEILQQENDEFSRAMSPEERASQGWLQMEKTNERLREALIRLRNVTQQQEAELKDQINELERDLEEYLSIKGQYESTKELLLASDNNVEDLKQQLETALGAEEMIEELAERNMQSQEEINALKSAVEDLEALKEVSDELEYSHIETEKQLQEEIERRESAFHEQSRRIVQQDETIEDMEYTLVRFRELVSTLQADLEDMRASKQLSETESSELTMRSRAMMDLNTKLQVSMSKAQAKTIDVELGRLEAEEATEHLSILKPYLPDYFDSERNSVLAFLRFKRVSFKASLMNNTIHERFSDQPISTSSVPEDFFAAYDAVGKLWWMSSISNRFINYITGCSAEGFGSIEHAFYELEPVERTLNSCTAALKRNEFSARKCVDELQRSVGVLSHLAETLLPSTPMTRADEICMQSVLTQAFLEETASSISYLKALVQSKLPPLDLHEGTFVNKMDALATRARRLKVAVVKISHLLEDLKARALAPPDDVGEPLKRFEGLAEKLSELVRHAGENVAHRLGEEGGVEGFALPEISQTMWHACVPFAESLGFAVEIEDALVVLNHVLHALEANLVELDSISSDLSRTSEFEKPRAPWIVRAEKLKSNKAISRDADELINRLKSEVQEASTALGVKDQTLEEQAIKVELLEARMREASKKASMVKDLESSNQEIRAREGDLSAMVVNRKKELQAMEAERDDYRTRLERVERSSGTAAVVATTADGKVVDTAMSLVAMRENEVLRTEIQSLQTCVRFLREENRRANMLDPYTLQRSVDMNSWLSAPLPGSRQRSDPAREMLKWQQGATTALEARDVFGHLIKLTQNSRVYDLKSTNEHDQESRAAWHPAKSRLRYHVLQQREEFERWSEWKDAIVRREREQTRLAGVHRKKDVARRTMVAGNYNRSLPSSVEDGKEVRAAGHGVKILEA